MMLGFVAFFIILIYLEFPLPLSSLRTASSSPRKYENRRNVTLAMCLLVKDEERDIIEWIEYHKSIGVTNIIVIDNNSTTPVAKTILKYIHSGFVIGYHYYVYSRNPSNPSNQLHLFNLCIRYYAKRFTHMGFLDVDEFIVLKAPQKGNVIHVLERYREFGGLTMNWVLYGSNGYIDRPEGGVLSNYRDCTRNCHVKSIVNTAHLTGVSEDSHHFLYKQGFYAVDSTKKKVLDAYNPSSENCFAPPTHLFEVIYINHYVTKSLEDFMRKQRRGDVNHGVKGARQLGFFHEINSKAVDKCDWIAPWS